MLDLTVIILTKNEENNIKKCIKSFNGIAKRFVIVDSYSDDATKEICMNIKKELNKEHLSLDFYENKFVNHATQLNWAIENTDISTKWTMRIDADEELLPELVREMQEKMPKLKEEINGIILRRRIIFMGKWIKHGGRYPELLLRIWRTGTAMCELKVMDEHMVLKSGKTITFCKDIQDNNQKDITWWTNKHNWYSSREVLDHQLTLQKQINNSIDKSSTQAKKKRLLKNYGYYNLPQFTRAHLYFIYRYYFKLGFLDGTEGKIFHFLQAYWYRFLVDVKLFECEKENKQMDEQGELKG